jgi:hypothetical protein
MKEKISVYEKSHTIVKKQHMFQVEIRAKSVLVSFPFEVQDSDNNVFYDKRFTTVIFSKV